MLKELNLHSRLSFTKKKNRIILVTKFFFAVKNTRKVYLDTTKYLKSEKIKYRTVFWFIEIISVPIFTAKLFAFERRTEAISMNYFSRKLEPARLHPPISQTSAYVTTTLKKILFQMEQSVTQLFVLLTFAWSICSEWT